VHCRLKASNVNLKVELYMNGDQIDPANDRKLVTQLGIRDKTVSGRVQVFLYCKASYSDRSSFNNIIIIIYTFV